ncbi:hypothetical protein, partial [Salmonella enterica]|uniref:hypothetical protein n=1 Tax=Salmonella enterica TaxID=28901 RepID=UPI001CB80BBF
DYDFSACLVGWELCKRDKKKRGNEHLPVHYCKNRPFFAPKKNGRRNKKNEENPHVCPPPAASEVLACRPAETEQDAFYKVIINQ